MKRFILGLLFLGCAPTLMALDSVPPVFFRPEPLPLVHPDADARPPQDEASKHETPRPVKSPTQVSMPVAEDTTESTVSTRVAYLQQLILSVRSLPKNERQRLRLESEAMFMGVCKSSDPTLALSCSLEAVASICGKSPKPAACLSMMDALMVERLNANRFISARERYEMMSRGNDHRQRMAEALNYQYGSLVTAFSLNQAAACIPSDFACLARGIESYCQAEAQKGRLSYQSCAALIGLFIGNHE